MVCWRCCTSNNMTLKPFHSLHCQAKKTKWSNEYGAFGYQAHLEPFRWNKLIKMDFSPRSCDWGECPLPLTPQTGTACMLLQILVASFGFYLLLWGFLDSIALSPLFLCPIISSKNLKSRFDSDVLFQSFIWFLRMFFHPPSSGIASCVGTPGTVTWCLHLTCPAV